MKTAAIVNRLRGPHNVLTSRKVMEIAADRLEELDSILHRVTELIDAQKYENDTIMVSQLRKTLSGEVQ